MEVKKYISAFYSYFTNKTVCYFCFAICESICCKDCESDFLKGTSRCSKCGKQTNNLKICGDCVISPPLISSTTVLFTYDYPVKELVLSFKFKKRVEFSMYFTEQLANKIRIHNKNYKRPEALIPVPLHKKRQALRGYNQSYELAKQLGNKLNINVDAELCKRIVNTNPQSQLPISSRMKNVKNAFALASSEHIPQHIAIIDDVITTGSTINEIARLFKNAGCKQIDVWAIART